MKTKILILVLIVLCVVTLTACDIAGLLGGGGENPGGTPGNGGSEGADGHVHTFEVVSTTPSTCTMQGYDIKICTECSHEEWDNFQPTAEHSFARQHDEDGHWKECTVCYHKEEADVHTFEVVTTPPTCTEQGYDTKTCTECYYEKKDNFQPTAEHSFAWQYNEYCHWKECAICYHKEADEAHALDALGACSVCMQQIASSEGVLYEIIGDKAVVTGYLGTARSVVIPSTYEGVAVVAVRARAFAGASIESIVIPESVREIGDYAFQACQALFNVTIQGEQTLIGRGVFDDCRGLLCEDQSGRYVRVNNNPFEILLWRSYQEFGEYFISEQTRMIGGDAFGECRNMTSIIMPSGITSVGVDAFANCTQLENVGIAVFSAWCEIEFANPTANPLYQVNALYVDGELIETLVIPEDVDRIGSYAFAGAASLTSITVGDTVKSIGIGAFSGCCALTSITVPFVGDREKGETDLYQYPFGYIFGTAAYDGSIATSQWYYTYTLFNVGDATYHIPGSLKTVTVTGGEILRGAFYNCRQLSSVTMPEDITKIASHAFWGCNGLKSIVIPKGVTFIGEDAYSNCPNVKQMHTEDLAAWCKIEWGNRSAVPSSRTKVLYCNGTPVTELVIPEGVTSIGKYAFLSYTSIVSVTVPDSLTSIGEDAFLNCTGLTRVYTGDVGAWCRIAFADVDSNPLYYAKALYVDGALATQLIIPDGVEGIGEYAFVNGASIVSVTIPDSVGQLGNSAFSGCTGLVSVTIPGSIEKISESVFRNCTGLLSITMLDGVVSIGKYAFCGCHSLASVTVPKSVNRIDSFAFLSCAAMESVYIEDLAAWCTIGFNDTSANPLSCGGKLYLDGQLVTDIVIPDSVSAIGQYAFYKYTSLTGVTIPEGVSSIGKYAFSGCSGLLSVVMLDGVTTIDQYAFYDCQSLARVTVPDSVTSIGESAFYNCSALTSVTIPEGVTSIGKSAFYNCSALTSVTIPDSVTYVGASAFYNCSKMESVTVGKGVKTIGVDAFANCSKLRSVHISDTDAWCRIAFFNEKSNPVFYAHKLYQNGTLLTEIVIPRISSIREYTFRYCSSLVSVVIPDSVTSIAAGAFANCTSLQSITIPFIGGEQAAARPATFGYLFGTDNCPNTKRIIQYGSSESYTAYYIPNSLRSVTVTGGTIPYGAFYNCDFLTDVTVGDGIDAIGEVAFYGCSGLVNVTLGCDIASIGENAFYNCSNLKNLYISDIDAWCGITFANAYTSPMYYASNLYLDNVPVSTLVIPDDVSSISKYAFYNCATLTSVTIPAGLCAIGEFAFYNCSHLGSVYISDLSAWCKIEFENVSANPLYGGGRLYLNETQIEHLEIPDDISSIKSYTFLACHNLLSVTIHDGVSAIGDAAFAACRSLKEITLPDTLVSIGDYAFEGCQSLEEITLPDTLVSIGDYAFDGCHSLTSITIPDSVISIGAGAFQSCRALVSVTLSAGLDCICEYMFEYCCALESVTIPEGVTSIGAGAFRDCTSLTNVTIPEGVTSIGAQAFRDCTSLRNVTVPSSLSSFDGEYAFYGCGQLIFNQYDNGCYLGNESNPYVLFMCYKQSINSCIIHPDTKVLYEEAFHGNYYLESITIPDGVVFIGGGAFYGCDNLTWIDAGPDGTYYSREGNLYSGTTLVQYAPGKADESFTIPAWITAIGPYAFSDCGNLKSVTIPEQVVSIGHRAFAYNYESLTIHFECTQGWWVSNIYSGEKTELAASDMSNSNTASKYLTITYTDCLWNRVEEA